MIRSGLALCLFVLWGAPALAFQIIGIVKSEQGPIPGAAVQIVGLSTDTTTSTGEFRIEAPQGVVGKKVFVQVDKPNWTLIKPYDSFIVPADCLQNPVTLIMGPSTPVPLTPPSDPDGPTISISAITDKTNGLFDVQYRTVDREGTLRIEPNVGYLDLLRNGGPISPVDWWWTPFTFNTPALDVKVVNNTRQTVFFQEAVFEIDESKLDDTPVFFIHGTGYRSVPLRNMGWGQLKQCSIRFDLFATSETAETNRPSAYTNDITTTVNQGNSVSIDSALRAAGVDLDTLASPLSRYSGGKYIYRLPNGATETLTEAENKQRHLRAVGKFKDDIVHVRGTIDYACASGCSGSVAFLSVVYLGEPGQGLPFPPSIEYNVKFQVDGTNYSVHTPISNALKPGDFDRFTFHIAADKSSQHSFTLKLIYNGDRVFTSRKVQLAFFSSKADSRLMEITSDLRLPTDGKPSGVLHRFNREDSPNRPSATNPKPSSKPTPKAPN